MTPSDQSPSENIHNKRSRWPLIFLTVALAGFSHSKEPKADPKVSPLVEKKEPAQKVKEDPFANTFITVLGKVRKPGKIAFPANGKLDLLTAIAISGGLSADANPKKVTLTRAGKKMIIDYKTLAQRKDGGVQLKPNDIVSIPKR